jgi:hypothetical protein
LEAHQYSVEIEALLVREGSATNDPFEAHQYSVEIEALLVREGSEANDPLEVHLGLSAPKLDAF